MEGEFIANGYYAGSDTVIFPLVPSITPSVPLRPPYTSLAPYGLVPIGVQSVYNNITMDNTVIPEPMDDRKLQQL